MTTLWAPWPQNLLPIQCQLPNPVWSHLFQPPHRHQNNVHHHLLAPVELENLVQRINVWWSSIELPCLQVHLLDRPVFIQHQHHWVQQLDVILASVACLIAIVVDQEYQVRWSIWINRSFNVIRLICFLRSWEIEERTFEKSWSEIFSPWIHSWVIIEKFRSISLDSCMKFIQESVSDFCLDCCSF